MPEYNSEIKVLSQASFPYYNSYKILTIFQRELSKFAPKVNKITVRVKQRIRSP
jgi:hypothetical protein